VTYLGGCQCGRVRYRAQGPRDRSSLCFCRMCQRASGGPFMAFVRFPADQVTWITPPDVFASSNKVERGFCRACGTPLSYRHVGGPNISLTLYSLDDPAAVEPDVGFTLEAKPAWLDRLDALSPMHMDFTGEPGFVSYQAEPGGDG
jgi:hypothetical protein